MNSKDLYHDYNLICKLKVSLNHRIRILSELMSSTENPWYVVGITHAALEIFKKHDFKRVSKMSVNRAHLVNRSKTYTEMLKNPINDFEKWWATYLDNDKTIFATASENKKNKLSDYLRIDPNKNLFKARGYAWRHGKDEIECLKELYKHAH